MFIFSTFALLAFANYKLIKLQLGFQTFKTLQTLQNYIRISTFNHLSATIRTLCRVILLSFALWTCLSALIPYYRPVVCFISIIHLLPYFIIFAILRSLSLGQMHSFTLSTHSSDRHLIFQRIFQRYFAYRTCPWISVVSLLNYASSQNRISLTNFTFSTKFQPVSS